MRTAVRKGMNLRKAVLLLWIVLCTPLTVFTTPSFAQAPEAGTTRGALYDALGAEDVPIGITRKEVELNREYWAGYLWDTKNILTSPLRWEAREWIKAALIAGITGGLYAFDQEIADFAQDNRNDISDTVAEIAEPFGNGTYTLPPLGLFYLYGLVTEDEKARRTALLSLESFVVAGLFTLAIKSIGHRHRPSSGDGPNAWDGPSFSRSHLSFSSGHSSAAFSIVTVIASEYEERAWIPPLAYGLATLTALSRVNDNAHWASDVFVGSAIGFFTAKAIVNLHRSESGRTLSFLPTVDTKQIGFAVSYRF